MNMSQSAATYKARVIGKKAEVEIAPGVKITPVSVEVVTRFAIARLLPAGDGTFRPVVQACEPWMRLTVALPRQLGLGICWKTLLRLITSGIIESRRTSPHSTEISIESLNAHLEGCRDPEYWTTPVTWPDRRRMTRLERWKEAI